MNICFFIGKIVSNIEFDFMINGKSISIIKFKVELEDKNIVIVKGYNAMADFCYKNLKKDDKVIICGEIDIKK